MPLGTEYTRLPIKSTKSLQTLSKPLSQRLNRNFSGNRKGLNILAVWKAPTKLLKGTHAFPFYKHTHTERF